MSSSPDALGNESKELKKRGTKKRKKKGANEPQRPVSAYALFFRDTQAAIKAENSSATFGEISKIVASMWDSLSEEDKQVYKQKTENAKRDYLKQLAAFRANMISKGCLEAEEEDSQPLSVLREKMAEQRTATSSPVHHHDPNIIDLTISGESQLPPPPKLHPAPYIPTANLHLQEPQLKLHPLPSLESSSQQIMTSLSQGVAPRPISPMATLTKIIVPGQNGAQSTIHVINAAPSTEGPPTVPESSPTPTQLPKHIFLRPAVSGVAPQGTSTITPAQPPPIKLRNIATHQSRSPITIVPSKPGQIIKVLPSGAGGVTFASISPETMKGRVVKMVDIVRPLQATGQGSQSLVTATDTTVDLDQTPILQLLHQESVEGIGSELNPNTVSEEVHENDLMQIPEQNLVSSGNVIAPEELMAEKNQNHSTQRQCVREGCTNQAVSCPYWDNEYCSNECVYGHCRDVFDAWVSTRQVTTSPV